MSKKMIQVTPRYGESFMVDTSDEACEKFKIPDKNGVKAPAKHGMKVIHHDIEGEGIVQGVARHKLWVSFESHQGNVGYSDPFHYIRA